MEWRTRGRRAEGETFHFPLSMSPRALISPKPYIQGVTEEFLVSDEEILPTAKFSRNVKKKNSKSVDIAQKTETGKLAEAARRLCCRGTFPFE